MWLMVLMVAAVSVVAQQDDVPILRPKKSQPKPAVATLLVMCDLACNWKLDGEAKGHIDAGGAAKARVELGQHEVVGATENGLDRVESDVEIQAAGQTIFHIALQSVQDSRLKAEQDARYRAAEEANEKAVREKSARDEASRLQVLHDHANERLREGQALQDQRRYREARPLLQEACDGGKLEACRDLGSLYDAGHANSEDYTGVSALYQKACEGGDTEACKDLGDLYNDGPTHKGKVKIYHSPEKAAVLYEKACDGGILAACNGLGVLYEDGAGVAQDFAQSRTLYQRACEGGEMPGCAKLSGIYYGGKGMAKDYALARTFAQKACDGGEMSGCTVWAKLYRDGNGVARNRAQAHSLFKKACDGGNQDACESLRKLR
jgi:TPR repeat protein